jgi:hypothetical protein
LKEQIESQRRIADPEGAREAERGASRGHRARAAAVATGRGRLPGPKFLNPPPAVARPTSRTATWRRDDLAVLEGTESKRLMTVVGRAGIGKRRRSVASQGAGQGACPTTPGRWTSMESSTSAPSARDGLMREPV